MKVFIYLLPFFVLLSPASLLGIITTFLITSVSSLIINKYSNKQNNNINNLSIIFMAVTTICFGFIFYNKWLTSEILINVLDKIGITIKPFLAIVSIVIVIYGLYSCKKLSYLYEDINSFIKSKTEDISNKIKDIIKDKNTKTIILTVFVTMIICYFEFLRNNYGNADWFNEGYYLYHNARWHLSLGRFLTKYVNLLSFNEVIPVLNVLICTFLQALSVILILRLWKIEKKEFVILSTIVIVAAPAVVYQYLYIHVATIFGFGLFFATFSAYISLTNDSFKSKIVSILLLALSLGCYQSYIGVTIGIIICTLILEIINADDITITISKIKNSLINGIGGSILYIIIWKVLQKINGVETADYKGADNIGIINIIKKLPNSLLNAYKDFVSFFTDRILNRNLFLIPLLIIGIVLTIYLTIQKSKQSKYSYFAIILLVLLPIGLNFVDIICADTNLSEIMGHQTQLFIIYLFALFSSKSYIESQDKLFSLTSSCLIALASIAYIVCAFATYKTVELSYKCVQTKVTPIIEEIISDEHYTNESKVMFVGFPNETQVKNSNPLFEYSYYKKSAVFWYDMDCSNIWTQYIYSTFGIDIHHISSEEKQQIINSNEYKNISDNSITRINDVYVVKFTDNVTN